MVIPGKARVAAAWLLAIPYLLLARPTPTLFGAGAGVALVGLLLRGWAAGSIDKDASLATGGPYAHTRNPLYLGSLVLGLGLAVAGGHWVWPAAFTALFVSVYVPTMARESARLRERFGGRFDAYATAVPPFLPRVTPYRAGAEPSDGFRWDRYLRHREWEALVGVVLALVVLALRMRPYGG